TPTINPLLIVQPRTVTQSVHLGTLRLALTASPVLPGPNRFIVTLVEHGRVIAVARVGLTAKMLEMPMRPVLLSVQAERDARSLCGCRPALDVRALADHRTRGTSPRHAPGTHVCAEPGFARGPVPDACS